MSTFWIPAFCFFNSFTFRIYPPEAQPCSAHGHFLKSLWYLSMVLKAKKAFSDLATNYFSWLLSAMPTDAPYALVIIYYSHDLEIF